MGTTIDIEQVLAPVRASLEAWLRGEDGRPLSRDHAIETVIAELFEATASAPHDHNTVSAVVRAACIAFIGAGFDTQHGEIVRAARLYVESLWH